MRSAMLLLNINYLYGYIINAILVIKRLMIWICCPYCGFFFVFMIKMEANSSCGRRKARKKEKNKGSKLVKPVNHV